MSKFRSARRALRNISKASPGHCPICGTRTVFLLTDENNPRWGFRCVRCRSVGRNRHVAVVLSEALGASSLAEVRRQGLQQDVYIAAASGYLLKGLAVGVPRLQTSEFMPGVEPGDLLADGHSTCQDLHHLTYDDQSQDLVVTEDVLEHVRHPDACFDEIHRVLRPGGKHIFTVPYVHDKPTVERVDTSGPEDVLLMEEEWHGDSIRDRVLAYRNFGYDIFDQLRRHGFDTELMLPSIATRRAGVYDSAVFVSTRI